MIELKCKFIYQIQNFKLLIFSKKNQNLDAALYYYLFQVDERLTIPHGTVNVHRYHHGMPLSLTNSSLRFPLSSLQLYPNQTVDITCLSTIPSYPTVGEGYADIQNQTITGKIFLAYIGGHLVCVHYIRKRVCRVVCVVCIVK